MFLGTHFPHLDDKGRLFLPAKYRDKVAEGIVITKGQERCLYLWPVADFARISETVSTAPQTTTSARNRARVFFASAFDEVPDKQGRITVPPALREYAGLRRDCAVVGGSSRMEIWDADAWREFLAEQESTYADDPEGVIPGVV